MKINGKTVYRTVGCESRSGTRIVVKLMCSKRDGASVYGSFVANAYYSYIGDIQADSIVVNGWFDRQSSSMQLAEAYATVTLVFDTQNVQGLTADGSDKYNPVYTLSTATEERPIEQHPRFLCSWAYNLYQLVPRESSGGPVPAWAASAKNPSAIHDGYLWSRTPPASPDPAKEYVQIQAASKFGVDTYLIPRPVVTSTVYYRTRQVSNSDLSAVGYLKAPAQTYIYGSSASCWLVTAGSVQEATDELMAVTTSYQYVEEGYDLSIYSLAT